MPIRESPDKTGEKGDTDLEGQVFTMENKRNDYTYTQNVNNDDKFIQIAQSAPIVRTEFNREVANMFNNSAVVSTANIIQELNTPGVLYRGISLDLFADEPTLGDNPQFPFSSSFRNSLRPMSNRNWANFGILAPEKLSEDMNRVTVNSNGLNHKRKANINTSQRDYSLSPAGYSRRNPKSIIKTLTNRFQRRSSATVTTSFTNGEEIENKSFVGSSEGGKHYAHIENVVLVGNIYVQLFKNPALKKQTWSLISEEYQKFFINHPEYKLNCNRTKGALERHFKVLKEQNRKEGGDMFLKLFNEFKSLE